MKLEIGDVQETASKEKMRVRTMPRATQDITDFQELFKETYETMFTGWQCGIYADRG